MSKVSVLLPVYNVEDCIQEALSSLLNQTYHDFEIIVVDDRSTDRTVDKINELNDARIKLIVNEKNMGRAGSDNIGIEYARGAYIAKMDGDDICHPERLAQQVAILDQYPEINVVGSSMQNFGDSIYLNHYPEHSKDAQVRTLFTLPVGNPSVMFRMALFKEQGMHYDGLLRQTEDYDFFARYIKQLKIYNIQIPLVNYRVFPQIRKKNILDERANVANAVREQLLTNWDIKFSERELYIHNTISSVDNLSEDINLLEVQSWFEKLLIHNQINSLFDQQSLVHGISERWYEVCYHHKNVGVDALIFFYRSNLSKRRRLDPLKHIKFILKKLNIIKSK